MKGCVFVSCCIDRHSKHASGKSFYSRLLNPASSRHTFLTVNCIGAHGFCSHAQKTDPTAAQSGPDFLSKIQRRNVRFRSVFFNDATLGKPSAVAIVAEADYRTDSPMTIAVMRAGCAFRAARGILSHARAPLPTWGSIPMRALCASTLPDYKAVTMPALSPTMAVGTILEWKKAEGDPIEAGEVIAEIETDKATRSFEYNDDGYMARVRKAGL